MNARVSINAQQRGSSLSAETSLRPIPIRKPLQLVATQGQVQIHTSTFRGSFSVVLSEALRSAGLGSKVLISQFLKGGVNQGPNGAINLCGRLEWLRPAMESCLPEQLQEQDLSLKRKYEEKAIQELWEYCKKSLIEKNLDKVKIFDASWHMPSSNRNAKKEYEETHIKGAMFWDVDEHSDKDSPYPHMMSDSNYWAEMLWSFGVQNDDHIVVYDYSDTYSSCRLWFALKYFGHQKVSVLDGGMQKWLKENRSTSNKINDDLGKFSSIDKLNPKSRYKVSESTGWIKSKKDIDENINDHIDLIKLNPMCRYFFDDGNKVDYFSSLDLMRKELDKAGEDFQNFCNFLSIGAKIYELSENIKKFGNEGASLKLVNFSESLMSK